jgi:hypothetical protein
VDHQACGANWPHEVPVVMMFFALVRDEEMFQQMVEEECCNNGNHQVPHWQTLQTRNPQTFGKDVQERNTHENPSRERGDIWKLVPEPQSDAPAYKGKNKSSQCYQHK